MNLYRLEMMKIRLSVYIQAVLGIFLSLLALGILFLFISQIENGDPKEAALFADWNGLAALTTALAFACFSVFAAAMAAKVVVSEYQGKNAVVLLAYPVSRKKILDAKCGIVCGFTTVSAFFCNLSVLGIMYMTARIFGIKPQMHDGYFVLTVLFSSFFLGILSSAVGIISSVFGWKKQSAVAAVVCSLLIVCTAANLITISPGSMTWVMAAMSGAFLITALFLYHILADKIEKMEV